MKKGFFYLVIAYFLAITACTHGQTQKFSTAGFYELPESGREVFSLNPAWKMKIGEVDKPVQLNYDDSDWKVVSLPNGIENLPIEASGCVNYQGVVWYRKKIDGKILNAKKMHFLHFEAIMGKSEVYVNGKLVKEGFGGYLPVIADISKELNFKGENIIAVKADNTNDPVVPPGKAQEVLDFTYAGGIYRDCWLITHNNVYITDPNYEDIVDGGGLVITTDEVSEKSAFVNVKYHLRNDFDYLFKGSVTLTLRKGEDKVKSVTQKVVIAQFADLSQDITIPVNNPDLWSPEYPNLYELDIVVKDNKRNVIDGYTKKVGIRSIKFVPQKGLFLNGKYYSEKLIGANRHQDFAIVGNALSNSLHWRDAKKLRDAGMTIIRNAHYPQDPAFMDACDELGLFVIVNTPGWQWWSKEPIFEKRVYSDIRNMIRRDRNYASIFLWEPILNETWYPADFAKNTLDIVAEEYKDGADYAACDYHAKGNEYFKVLFSHPVTGLKAYAVEKMDPNKLYFTREFGDNVDTWSAHNSPSRVSMDWGEIPMLIQADGYANPTYTRAYTCIHTLNTSSVAHLGGCLWHSFDHQRGYHPDPFYGGIMNSFRYPKTSYYMFKAQRNPKLESELYETGPMIHIANEMTPFSPKDVTVYSNCDSVTLKVFSDGEVLSYVNKKEKGIKYPIIVFENTFDWFEYKLKSRKRNYAECFIEANGYIDGKLVATDIRKPSLRASLIKVWIDDNNLELEANGGDLVTVHAAVTDENGVIKRLNNQNLVFEVEGEGELLLPGDNCDNIVKVEYGIASALVRSTCRPGEITVKVKVKNDGAHAPKEGSVTFTSKPAELKMVFDEELANKKSNISSFRQESGKKKDFDINELKKVEKQQDEFGEKTN